MADYTMAQAIKKAVNIPPIAYDYSGGEYINIIKDKTYCRVKDKQQTFDVYYPNHFVPFQSTAVLFVNGGGPIDKDYKAYPCFTSWGELAAVNNIVGITFNWRSGKYKDISIMLEYLKTHAAELGISFEHLTVFPLCRAVNHTINCVLEYPEIKKVALYYGEISKSTKVEKCVGMRFLIALGNKDRKFPAECNDWFMEQSKDKGYEVELLIHPQGVHGFDYANRDQYTKEIIEKTIAFIKQ